MAGEALCSWCPRGSGSSLKSMPMFYRMPNTVFAKRSEEQQGRSVWSQALVRLTGLGGLNSGSVESELGLGIIQV